MKRREYLKASSSGCSINVDASPGATKTEIVGVNRWRGALQIRIAAPPKDGAANDELVRFLAERLSVPKSSVTIVKGERSSLKVVTVPLALEKVESILGGD
jgi:uncharacterized protein (TIGR00251 family)